SGIADTGQDRQPAETGDNFAQELKSLTGKIDRLVRQAGDVAPRSRQAGHEIIADRVSPTELKTIGIANVACFAARTSGVEWVTMTLTLSRTNSTRISAERSLRPSPHR